LEDDDVDDDGNDDEEGFRLRLGILITTDGVTGLFPDDIEDEDDGAV